MNLFTGTAGQLRLRLRLDRTQLLIWIVAVGTVFFAVSASMTSLYPEPAQRATYAALNEASPVLKAVNGPGYALDTLGGIMLNEVGAYTLIAVALLAVVGTARASRAAEERGHTELILVGAVGTLAPLASALLIIVAASAVIGVVCALALVFLGEPNSGAWLFGLSVAAVGVLFAGLTALCAQLFPTGESTMAVAGSALGFWYVIRGAGDLASIGILTASSPFGWVQYAAPFAAEQRIWPVCVTIAVGAALSTLALVVRSRRDLGAAPMSRGHGPAEGGRASRGLLPATWKLAVPNMVGWATGVAFLGAVFGFAADELSTLFEASPEFALVLGTGQAELSDKYLLLVVQLVGLLAAAFAISAAQRQRTLERRGLIDQTLATSVSRPRWLFAAVLPGLAGAMLVLAAGGAALGAAFAAVTDDPPAFARLLVATLWQLPAVWLLASLAVALLGAFPKFFAAAWAAYAVVVVIGLLGQALQLPQPALNVSPFTHVPQLPPVSPSAGLWIIIAAALALSVAGFLRIRVRDIGR